MRKTNMFQLYIWLVSTIHQAGKISLKEINQRWLCSSKSDGLEIHRNTFSRYKAAIEEIFDINIECDPKDNFKYYIENTEALREDSIQNWLLSSMTVHTAVQDSVSLRNRILLEEIPSGQEFLQPLLEAMKTNHCIDFIYKRYDEAKSKSYAKAEPYCLKLYKQRWYLLARVDDLLRTFSLDRIKSLDIQEESFHIAPDFNAETHFRDCYGVYRTGHDHPQKVVLRAIGTEVDYLRDLPLHHSQREISTHIDYSDFAYHLCPSEDFIGEILRKSDRLKVMEPQTLQDKIHTLLKNMLNIYE